LLERVIRYRLDSRLLLINGCEDYTVAPMKGCGASYYEIKDGRFRLVARLPPILYPGLEKEDLAFLHEDPPRRKR
jgi:hypothetical protein